MSYQLVEQLHKKAVTVEQLCRVLGVSRSGYYGFREPPRISGRRKSGRQGTAPV